MVGHPQHDRSLRELFVPIPGANALKSTGVPGARGIPGEATPTAAGQGRFYYQALSLRSFKVFPDGA